MWKRAFNAVCSFFYPRLCLGCSNEFMVERFFCKGCAPQFELIEPKGRCPYCFRENIQGKVCRECLVNRHLKVKIAAAWEHHGAPAHFLNAFKQGDMPYLSKVAASFLMVQFSRLDWPLPDYIIPAPKRKLIQSCHPELLVAKALGSYLKVPIREFVGRKRGDLPRGIPHEPEEIDSFYLKRKSEIADKTILIVDDFVASGVTMRSMTETLLEGFPKRIYGLALARKDRE